MAVKVQIERGHGHNQVQGTDLISARFLAPEFRFGLQLPADFCD